MSVYLSKGAEMKELWAKANIYLLSLAAVAVACYLAICWGDLAAGQRSLGFFCIGITLHEWEEMRFPGGFYDLMLKKFRIEGATPLREGVSHGVVVIAIAFFAFVPFLLWEQAPWLAGIPAILGFFEAFIHIMGIRIHRMPHPYTPGMATALLCLLPVAVCIVVFAMPGVGIGGWALAIVCHIAIFALMELGVLKSFHVDLRTMPQRIREVRKEVLGR